MDSEGLLLMTNDGELTRRLLHPGEEVEKTYHVWVYGPVAGAAKRLAAVTDLEGECIRPAGWKCCGTPPGRQSWLLPFMRGKTVRSGACVPPCGLTVKRLRRVREHTLELGTLPPGTWRYLSEAERMALTQSSQ